MCYDPPTTCFVANFSNINYDNIAAPATFSVPYGKDYRLFLEDAFGDGWTDYGRGPSSVTIPVDGIFISQSFPTFTNTTTITFDVIPDTDGDGILDSADLDDDNDGITDFEEYCSKTTSPLFPSSGVGTRSLSFTDTDTNYARLNINELDSSFQFDVNGTGIHNSILELEASNLAGGEILIIFQSDDAQMVTPWNPNVNGLPRVRVIINESGEVIIYGTRNTNSISLELMYAQGGLAFNTVSWVAGINNFFIENQNGSGPEELQGDFFTSSICDDDGDGLDNSLDLDSDNDGVYDLFESGAIAIMGVNDVDNDGVIDGVAADFGANGMFSGIENNDFEYADLTYTILDSDSDGNLDFIELDADNDGCNDVIEAGYTDDNGDGILGPVSIIIDNTNGKVTSGVDGYTIPDDNNTNSIFEFQETGIAPNISMQPSINQLVFSGNNALFTVIASDADLYQWQISEMAELILMIFLMELNIPELK